MTQQPRQRESLTLLEIAQAWLRGDLITEAVKLDCEIGERQSAKK